MRLPALRKPRPDILARFDQDAGDLGIVGEKMLDQVQAEVFQWLDGMLAREGVHGIFHSVGGKDFAIVALHVGRFKITFETYGHGDLANIVTALLLRYAQQMNSRTAVA